MKEASPFEVEGLVRGYPRGAAWHCTFYTPAGRTRLKLATKNKRQAERRAREIAELIQREDWEALSKLDWKPKPQAGTFALFVRDEFLPNYCSWSERTRKGEASRLKILCEQFGALPLSAVTASAIKTWLSRREAEGLSAATSNRYLAALKSVFKAAVTYGYCKTNPAAAVTMKKEEVRPKDVLDDDEFERLLAELPDYSRRIVLAAAESGMRASEIRRLRWEDVDLAVGELRVAVAKNKEFRAVPLTDRLQAVLEEMRAELTLHPTAPVFERCGDQEGPLGGPEARRDRETRDASQLPAPVRDPRPGGGGVVVSPSGHWWVEVAGHAAALRKSAKQSFARADGEAQWSHSDVTVVP